MKQAKIFFLIMVICGAYTNVAAQLHWESLVLESEQFSYLVPESAPAANWITLDYDDSAWSSGNGGFGYADGDDRTTIAATASLFLRKKITLPASVTVDQLLLDIDYDDAFVAYINGVEVARSANLLAGTPELEGSVTTDHEAVMYSGGLPERFYLEPEVLAEGENILAVHILNVGITSSDLSARIFLNAQLDSDQTIFNPVPDWFIEPLNYESSNLPLIKINTQGQNIVDEPKITAIMQVINKAEGRNYYSDTVYEYNGYVGIEIRGNTAQMFPKKSYTVETRLSNGENNNVPLLGMPVENDWVLHGPYSDKSLMRNALAYHIGNSMENGWHPHTRFVELEINNEYRGVYLFVEKIKIDKNRVDIADLRPEDISGDELTGGYIISIDRDQEGSWNSPFMGRTGSVDVPFSYVDPKYDELGAEQRAYIREYITDFEYALAGTDYKDPQLGYRAYINISSFIDYFIITELSKDLDGYRVSVYFHKDKDSKDGRLSMTPFWDYNLCFGNANFFSAGYTSGWASDGIGAGDAYEVPFWWDKFRTDPYFESLLKLRWQHLRKEVISKTTLNGFIDSVAATLDEAQARNFEKFNILSTYVWPNNNVGGTYPNEVNYLKNWISDRLDWIDSQIDAIDALDLDTPVVYTVSANDITKDSATVGGDITSDGNAYVWERGVYVGVSPDPIQDGKKFKAGEGTGRFALGLNLYPGTKYYFKAYAENDLGRSFGELDSFITESAITTPSVYSVNATSITDSSAVVAGTVTANGGSSVYERGIYLDTLANPELNGIKILAGSGTGSFTIHLDSLKSEQEYYTKAFASNSVGTSYGEETSFTTLEGPDVNIDRYNISEEDIIAYPNPFEEQFTIRMNLEFSAKVEIRIFNILGEQVIIQARNCQSGTNQFFFDAGEIQGNGNVYFYNVLMDGKVVRRGKIVKR